MRLPEGKPPLPRGGAGPPSLHPSLLSSPCLSPSLLLSLSAATGAEPKAKAAPCGPVAAEAAPFPPGGAEPSAALPAGRCGGGSGAGPAARGGGCRDKAEPGRGPASLRGCRAAERRCFSSGLPRCPPAGCGGAVWEAGCAVSGRSRCASPSRLRSGSGALRGALGLRGVGASARLCGTSGRVWGKAAGRRVEPVTLGLSGALPAVIRSGR